MQQNIHKENSFQCTRSTAASESAKYAT